MQTFKELIQAIELVLPEISEFTIKVAHEIEDGAAVFYDQDGNVLFEAATAFDLRTEYGLYVHANYPDYVPF